MSTDDRPHCQYSPSEGDKWRDWPEAFPVPTLRTLIQLKREHDLTLKHYPKSGYYHHSNKVIFCAVEFHAFRINGKEWDCKNGWREGKEKLAKKHAEMIEEAIMIEGRYGNRN